MPNNVTYDNETFSPSSSPNPLMSPSPRSTHSLMSSPSPPASNGPNSPFYASKFSKLQFTFLITLVAFFSQWVPTLLHRLTRPIEWRWTVMYKQCHITSQTTGVPLPTTNSTPEWEKCSTHRLARWWSMASLIQPTTTTASVWAYSRTWIAIRRSRTLAATLAREYIWATSMERCSPNVSPIRQSLFNHEIVIEPMAFIPPLFAKFPTVVRWRFSTMQISLSYSHRRSMRVSSRCLNWSRCAQFGCRLWKAGALNITARMLPPLPVGSRFISTAPYFGSTRCSPRWALQPMPSRVSRRNTTEMLLLLLLVGLSFPLSLHTHTHTHPLYNPYLCKKYCSTSFSFPRIKSERSMSGGKRKKSP